ncbi:MAG: hypothetical protein CVU44_10045 [Chloroflexi bacterium HGW-Chloroflexi-6]|nr:MAG: hypothetical protein CVU44_10045 [Chloroflexi bacterium HGW-Chloroflexi-6]
MNDFLEFLNTADTESLQKTPGVSPALAERIIAARPFASLEDCRRVSGLGEKLIQRLQDSFQGTIAMSEETSLVPSPSPEPESVPSRPELAPKPQSNFGQRLGRAFVGFLKFLLTLFIILVILGGIGAGLYFGLPYLYQVYVVPVNQNTARIADVAHQQARDVLALQAEIDLLKERDMQFETQLATIETAIETHTTSLARLDEMQAKLDLAANQEREGLNAELSRQIELTRAIELLSRARLYLSQSNFGQARLDVQSARDLLTGLRVEFPADKLASLDAVLSRLDLVLGNLPDFPVIAVDDLNIAWNLLVLGLPETGATP